MSTPAQRIHVITPSPQDLDLNRLVTVLRRAAWPVLLAAAALALAAYLYARAEPPTFQATASLAALPSEGGNSVISNTLVTAPPLPPAVVERAIRSPELINDVLRRLSAEPIETRAAREALVAELRTGNYRLIGISSNISQELVGVYDISARAPNAELSRTLANTFASALLDWDRRRALKGVERARQTLEAQRDALAARIAAAASEVDRRSLVSARGDVIRTLQQVAVLDQTVSGTLTALSAALAPAQPTAPRPRRSGLLVFAAALFFGALAALGLDGLRRPVRGASGLEHLAAPTLGSLPPLPARPSRASPLLLQVGQGAFFEQMGFVRIGLLAAVGRPGHAPAVAVSSARAKEGKSTVVAGLAASTAAHGLRTLIVDADASKPRQKDVWLLGAKQSGTGAPREAGGFRLYAKVAANVDLAVPLGPGFGPERVAEFVREHGSGYDLVLVDAPPMLKVADALALGRLLDGMLVVVDGQTSLAQVERAVQQAEQVGASVLGLVVNRSREAGRGERFVLRPYARS